MRHPSKLDCTLNDDDLPALKFDKYWKSYINNEEFENSTLGVDTGINIYRWITNFNLNLIKYFKDTSNNFSSYILEKRCRDINYYVDFVLGNISKLQPDAQQAVLLKDQVNAVVQLSFDKSNAFKCERNAKEYKSELYLRKKLDDYCENRRSFQGNLKKGDPTLCCKYSNHVKETKSTFNRYITQRAIDKDHEDFHIDDECTLRNMEVTFPEVTCDTFDMSGIRNEKSIGEDTDLEFGLSPLKLVSLTGSTFVGTFLISAFLYKFTSIGSLIHTYKMNKSGLQEGMLDEEIDNMFTDSPNYLSTHLNNAEYNVAYYQT
ncbi:PIR Superfamily Protein [Plasmodium ovale wallikeri]|uniref:PIR protein n=2 Tax=Plasmodium ovale TaxID=36330 RepID=A0A1C3KJ84_PLAOA|nr:PIR Superfamily Protein [Plasmodium ovale wallikeri]SBT73883.1 PIR protein [Plasmodium ovale]